MNHGKTLSTILSGILCTVSMLFFSPTGYAQGSWELITAANSILPCDSVRTLVADSAGNIWVATIARTAAQEKFIDAGLCRFDGSGWTTELSETTTVWGMTTGPNGTLYAVLFPEGEAPKVWHRKNEWKPIPSDRSSTSISGMAISQDGALFGWETGFAEPWFFLYLPDPITGEPGGTEYEQLLPTVGGGNYSLSTAAIDGNNVFWIIADQYEWTGGQYGRKETPSVLLALAPGAAGWEGVNLDRDVTSVGAGRGDVSGFGTTDGFLVHRGTVAAQNWTMIEGVTSARRVAQDAKGNFWIVGTAQKSGAEERLLYYNAANNRLSNLSSLPYDPALITAMTPDMDGNLWIGYNGKGISLWRPGTSAVLSGSEPTAGFAAVIVPNPAYAVAELRCTLPGPTHLVVEVFDGLGRRVETIYEGEAAEGERKFAWNGNGTAGIYYYRIGSRFGTATVPFVQINK